MTSGSENVGQEDSLPRDAQGLPFKGYFIKEWSDMEVLSEYVDKQRKYASIESRFHPDLQFGRCLDRGGPYGSDAMTTVVCSADGQGYWI